MTANEIVLNVDDAVDQQARESLQIARANAYATYMAALKQSRDDYDAAAKRASDAAARADAYRVYRAACMQARDVHDAAVQQALETYNHCS